MQTPTDLAAVQRFGYVVVASSLHDPDRLQVATDPTCEQLDRLGGTNLVVVHDETDRLEPFSERPDVIIVGTGGTEAEIIEWLNAPSADAGPVVLIAHSADNSLPAALEAAARLRQLGSSVQLIPESSPESVAQAVSDLLAWKRMQELRIGVVGSPSSWLVASTIDGSAIARHWGPTLVDIDISPIIESGQKPAGEVAVQLGKRWLADSSDGGSEVPSAHKVERAAVLHGPLVDTIEHNELDAITVGCFDLLQPTATTGCLALAELNHNGVVAGCEGDIASVVAMAWVRELLDEVSWMANPASIDRDRGEVLLAHCTVAPSMVGDYELTTHFESGIGIGISGEFEPGPVTLIRLGGVSLDKQWIVDGVLTGSSQSPDHCRTQAIVEVTPEQVRQLVDEPLGNHLVLVRGHHARHLDRWWRTYVAGRHTDAEVG